MWTNVDVYGYGYVYTMCLHRLLVLVSPLFFVVHYVISFVDEPMYLDWKVQHIIKEKLQMHNWYGHDMTSHDMTSHDI